MRKYGTISLALSLCIHLLLAWILYAWLQSPKAPPQPQRISLGNLKLETLPNARINTGAPPQAAQAPAPTPKEQQPAKPATSAPTQQEAAQKPKSAQNPQATTKAQSAPNVATAAPPSFYQLLQDGVQNPEIQNTWSTWQELYGDEAHKLGKDEKAYLDENYRKIYIITQRNLRYPQQAGRLGLQGTNRVEFFLQPNGDITDLKITSPSGYEMFDKNSLRTIEISYKDYPRPKKPLKIIFYINYRISY